MTGITTTNWCLVWIINYVQRSDKFSVIGVVITCLFVFCNYFYHSYSLSVRAMDLKFVFRELSGNELQRLPEGVFDGLAELSRL